MPAELSAARERYDEEWQRRQDACGPLVRDIVGVTDPTPLLQELDESKNFRVDYLVAHHGVTEAHVEALYDFARFRYDSGEYDAAIDYLQYYRVLALPMAEQGSRVHQERCLQALWGRFAAQILTLSWDAAKESQLQLVAAIRHSNQPDVQVVQQRAWLLHWSLFMYANVPNGRDALVDFFLADSARPGLGVGGSDRDKITNLNVILLACPWLLRYVIAAVLINQKHHRNLKLILRLLTPADVEALKDPVVDFIYCLLVSFDFEGSQRKLADCASVIATDYFLSSMMSPQEYMAAARRFVFEVYCRVHEKIDLVQLAAQLRMGADEAEKWIVDLIRSAQIEARLDTRTRSVTMQQPDSSLYQSINDQTRDIVAQTRRSVENVANLAA